MYESSYPSKNRRLSGGNRAGLAQQFGQLLRRVRLGVVLDILRQLAFQFATWAAIQPTAIATWVPKIATSKNAVRAAVEASASEPSSKPTENTSSQITNQRII